VHGDGGGLLDVLAAGVEQVELQHDLIAFVQHGGRPFRVLERRSARAGHEHRQPRLLEDDVALTQAFGLLGERARQEHVMNRGAAHEVEAIDGDVFFERLRETDVALFPRCHLDLARREVPSFGAFGLRGFAAASEQTQSGENDGVAGRRSGHRRRVCCSWRGCVQARRVNI
jgi:hypothetical protein